MSPLWRRRLWLWFAHKISILSENISIRNKTWPSRAKNYKQKSNLFSEYVTTAFKLNIKEANTFCTKVYLIIRRLLGRNLGPFFLLQRFKYLTKWCWLINSRRWSIWTVCKCSYFPVRTLAFMFSLNAVVRYSANIFDFCL